MEKIIITGGSGAIGSHLIKLLTENLYEIIVFTRHPEGRSQQNGVKYVYWNPSKNIIDKDAIQEADYIINLAGENLNGSRWTKAFQQKIISSRVESGELISNVLKQIPNKVKAVISASAIGWYGKDMPHQQHPFEESSPQGGEFLSWVCTLWEDCIRPVGQLGIRLAILRFGVVLSEDQGMLKEINKGLRYRMAPILGNGNQMLSWIHMEDLCRLILFAIQNESAAGTFNACASEPSSFRKFVRRLASHRYGYFYLPIRIPSIIIKTVFGKKGQEMILNGTWASNQKIITQGFRFKFPVLDAKCIDSLQSVTSQNAKK